MRFKEIIIPVLCVLISFTACKKDSVDDVVVIPPRDRGEQQIADNESIVKYLNTHYYNVSDFDGNTNPKIKDLKILELETGETLPDGNTLLMGAVETKTTDFGGASYKYYILRLNQGGGEGSPTFADRIRVVYEAFLLNGTVVDDNKIIPSEFDLVTEVVVSGWRRVFPEFNVAENFVENNDGTIDYVNSGVGVMFLPSGLAYFSNAQPGVPAYSPLFFKFELLEYSENDHDNDGVPSWMEDRNGDGEFFTTAEDKSDDTDGDGKLNIVDNDDDNDGVPTLREDINKDGNFANDDSNGNGIPNYLDKEDTIAN